MSNFTANNDRTKAIANDANGDQNITPSCIFLTPGEAVAAASELQALTQTPSLSELILHLLRSAHNHHQRQAEVTRRNNMVAPAQMFDLSEIIAESLEILEEAGDF